LPHQGGAGVEQVEALALHVLLRHRSRQSGHDGDVAAGGCCVGEPGRQQRGLHPPAAVRRRRRRAGELRDALRHAKASAAGDDPVAQRKVTDPAGGGEVPCGPGEDLPWELVMQGHALGVGVGEAMHDDVQPLLELLLAAWPGLDPRWGDPLRLAPKGQAEDVVKQHEPIAPPGQHGANRGIGEVGQFDLHRRAYSGVGPLDPFPRRRARHTAEAEPRDLVVRRARSSEARHATRDGQHKGRVICPAAGCLASLGNELRLRPLDALSQGGVAKQGQPARNHP
jgi:hypothetical protein